ncbi:exocyst complex component Exo84 [Haemaphysalis longicornis]
MAEYVAVGDKFTSPGFSPTNYVKNLVENSIRIDAILNERQHIANLADETNNLLKKNVYKNYMQFIETAKEISYLESEMYQLSHMLTEQQHIMETLQEISITECKGSTSNVSPAEKKDEDLKGGLSTLLEKVEGCSRLLDVQDRRLVRSGEMNELRGDNVECKVYLVLLSDGLLIADYMPHRRGTIKYRFQMFYELDSLALVDIREDKINKNCFKILTFPQTRLFRCETGAEKRAWMEAIEQAKQAKMAEVSLKRESALLDPKGSLLSSDSNPFDEDEAEDLYECEGSSLLPDWLSELPEDLDVCVAERDFEAAVNLVLKTEEHFALYPKAKPLEEMRPRIDHRVKHLVDVLTDELHVSPGRSVQGGPRAARRAVSLLIKLGKSSQACALFLKHRSATLKHSMRQQKMEGSTTPYIQKLCELFFGSMVETGREFGQAFSSNNSCASAFVVWAKNQLQGFVKLFSNHVFTTQVSLSVATECIVAVRTHCDRLWEIGLDLSFFLEKLLKNDVERIITDSRDKALEAIKLRAAEDRWRPQNLYNKAGLQKLADDMNNVGISSIAPYVYDECWVSLSCNTVSFCKTFLNLLDDLLKLHTPVTRVLVLESLASTFRAHMRHVDASLGNKSFKSDAALIQSNASFLLETLLDVAEKRCDAKLPHLSQFWNELRQEFASCLPSSTGTTTKGGVTFL